MDKCLPELLWEQARARPESVAVVYEDEILTYHALAERSSELAVYLQHLGVALDDCVGMFVEPSIDLMVGAWGILSSGGAYLPLSPEYPEERLRYMLEDSRAKVIFSQERLKTRLAELAPRGTRIVTLNDAAEFARANTKPGQRVLDTGLRPNNLAYIIYTSGSTGRPKGVMIEHRSIVNQMHWLKTVYQLNGEKVVLQKTPMSFDAAQWEILAPSCGSRVIMGGPGVYRDPGRLIETIARHKVTTLQCVPTLLQALLDTEELHSCESLTQIFSGGEALSRNLALQCLKAMPKCELVNLYGPTECTINSSAFTVDRTTVKNGPNTISIGVPVHNTQYYILDQNRAPVAVGEIGELFIGGVQLARGYLHRPDLTADRFIDNPFRTDPRHTRLYKTGDLAFWNADGSVQFAGRTDNQVKLRGFRVELDEIRVAIETHEWVKNAAVIIKNDPHTGFQNLISFIELNPKEAALMDQGNHGAHHQSKKSKLQVKAQLSNMGCRDIGELAGKEVVDLPGKTPTQEQRRLVFARKTYRFYEGGDVKKEDLLRLLGEQVTGTFSRGLDALSFNDFGELLRYFGQYLSEERLLPKYGYASPGALCATQMYFELDQIGGLKPGYYYYHPVHHQLILIREKAGQATAQVKIHFMGKKRAIQPVYKNNIQEVLEIETGHMVGLFEKVLPRYGLDIRDLEYAPSTRANLECADEDYYLGTFELVPYAGTRPDDSLELYVQAHPGRIADLPAGQYQYKDGGLEKISDELVLKKHVIAINQRVYEDASVGITVISKTRKDWMRYVELGRKLQHLQMNDLQFGFMSSGYSSKSGNDLPSAKRMESILKACGREAGPSYFFVGGRVSQEQMLSEGMKEDSVHMKGPAELIKDDLVNFLPDYMVPNRVIILDKMPLTANGKIDFKALEKTNVEFVERPFVAPRTAIEERISVLWKKEMKRDSVSVQDDFFESGGNSLIAVALINKLNKEFRTSLPMQVVFECPTIEKLALKIGGGNAESSSRLVRLQAEGTKNPIYCWPGLGGYTMNLRVLASKMGTERPFYGVQAHGLNKDETPYPTIKEMAAEDIKLIKRLQPVGPYTLWGYSFGARVAFETAYQLEQSGERVEHLFLIAPGMPKVRVQDASLHGSEPTYTNKAYVTILFSVFAGSITGPVLDECLKVAKDEESFASFISGRFENLDPELVKRIIKIVAQTYSFKYEFRELAERELSAPITIFKAQGDDYSFIENSSGYSAKAPAVMNLEADHYGLLKEPSIGELLKMIRYRLRTEG
ncbi:amino acid adenylation domain-containing protein [Archangium minus]|uniref:Amino acid adenylation domain-containing protein n=1 Tax=Archangium minus TaxID=83450 RepID=A0ABY9WHX1_9BACT|nr:amino acid adenylation domain-containing protein [Archangium minus]